MPLILPRDGRFFVNSPRNISLFSPSVCSFQCSFLKKCFHLIIGRSQTLEIQSNEEVRGVTFKGLGMLYVLRATSKDQIDVYHINVADAVITDTFDYFSTDVDNFWDIASSTTSCFIYVSDHVERDICQVAKGYETIAFGLNCEPRGLSMLRNGMLLVTCRYPSKLVVLDYDAERMSETSLDATIEYPWHAVQLSTGDYAVCHGSGPYSLHRVCIVARSGRIVKSFGSTSGQARNELNVPCHLAVDEHDFIFVADCLNQRVTLLTPTLNFVYHVVEHMRSRPQRLYLEQSRKRLYVGMKDGDVIVIQM